MYRTLTLFSAAVIFAAIACAQETKVILNEGVPPPPMGKDRVFFYQSTRTVGDPLQDLKPVLNAPYQAQAETQTIQRLADGNTIQNTHTMKMARDSKGRTWTEQTIDQVGPWSSAGAPETIDFISDPAVGVSYVLHASTKTADRMSLHSPVQLSAAVPAKMAAEAATSIARERIVAPGPVGISAAISGPGAAAMLSKLGAEGATNEQKEDLGMQQINGVTAQGKRATSTIPANTIGNQLPIVTVTETWYSPELQTVVQSKRDDPRFGETTFALKNIQKGEPPADLFQVPSDYTVNDPPKMTLPLKP